LSKEGEGVEGGARGVEEGARSVEGGARSVAGVAEFWVVCGRRQAESAANRIPRRRNEQGFTNFVITVAGG
jgi:hypothetical protein